MIIQAASAVINGKLVENTWVEVADNTIVQVVEGIHQNPDQTVSGTLIPGFIDIHCHGGGGYYFSATSEDAIKAVIAAHRQAGTTSVMASLVTENIQNLKAQIQRLVPFYERGEILGIHLEGPFLSHARCGAHEPSLLIDPSIEVVKDLIEVGQGSIKMITIAPELTGSLDVIKYLSSVGVISAIGHTEGSSDDASLATDNGATVVTHFLNAMNKVDSDGSIARFIVNDPRLTVELIVDGHHISFEKVADVLRSIGSRIILVSDALAAAGSVDGDYTIGALPVQVKDGVARLRSNQALAGSTLTISQAFNNVVKHCGFSVVQAVAATSSLPAQVLGLQDRGSISAGMRADLLSYDNASGSVQLIN